jgi:hypothetical protein
MILKLNGGASYNKMSCTVFFHDDQDEPDVITCERLVSNIFEKMLCSLHTTRTTARAPDLGRPPLRFDEDLDEDDDGDASGLDDPMAWELVAKLQWAARSDRLIEPAWVQRVITRMRADGELAGVAGALRQICRAMKAASPVLAAEPLESLAQIAALGIEVARAVTVSPELLVYFKSEQQAVELGKMVGM